MDWFIISLVAFGCFTFGFVVGAAWQALHDGEDDDDWGGY